MLLKDLNNKIQGKNQVYIWICYFSGYRFSRFFSIFDSILEIINNIEKSRYLDS